MELNEKPEMEIWGLLRDFGFESTVGDSFNDTLIYDFGNLKLEASLAVNRFFVDVVMFGAILRSRRTLTDICFELPRRVTSREQCAAWIVWHLDQYSDTGVFEPARSCAWVLEGRLHRNRVPIVAAMAAYEARPRGLVRRDWFRVALKTLAQAVAPIESKDDVVLGFDGGVLTFTFSGRVHAALPADGEAWRTRYRMRATGLQRLPKRLMQEVIEVSIWERTLRIGRNVISGVVLDNSNADTDPV